MGLRRRARRVTITVTVTPLALCPSVCLSVTGQCSVEIGGWMELVFGMEASLDLSCTLLFETLKISVKISALPSETRHGCRPMALCPCVCLSAAMSQVGVPSKPMDGSSWF